MGQGQPFEALALLLERPGQVVTREELQQKLWVGDTFVDFEHGLNKLLRVREARPTKQTTLVSSKTLPCRRYRFIAPVVGGETLSVADREQGPTLLPQMR